MSVPSSEFINGVRRLVAERPPAAFTHTASVTRPPTMSAAPLQVGPASTSSESGRRGTAASRFDDVGGGVGPQRRRQRQQREVAAARTAAGRCSAVVRAAARWQWPAAGRECLRRAGNGAGAGGSAACAVGFNGGVASLEQSHQVLRAAVQRVIGDHGAPPWRYSKFGRQLVNERVQRRLAREVAAIGGLEHDVAGVAEHEEQRDVRPVPFDVERTGALAVAGGGDLAQHRDVGGVAMRMSSAPDRGSVIARASLKSGAATTV